MNILLDESLPIRFAKELKGHIVSTVVAEGWSGKKNGELLKLAETKFDIFVTIDQNLQYQVNLIRSKICIIVLTAKSNRFEDIRPMALKVVNALKNLPKGIVRIS